MILPNTCRHEYLFLSFWSDWCAGLSFFATLGVVILLLVLKNYLWERVNKKTLRSLKELLKELLKVKKGQETMANPPEQPALLTLTAVGQNVPVETGWVISIHCRFSCLPPRGRNQNHTRPLHLAVRVLNSERICETSIRFKVSSPIFVLSWLTIFGLDPQIA